MEVENTLKNVAENPVPLTRYAWLSIVAALVTITMKSAAYFLTGSVGLLSDALESTVNLAAAMVALLVLRLISRPANDEFTFGYSKAEYFSSGFEGGMILLAAVGIITHCPAAFVSPAAVGAAWPGPGDLGSRFADQPGCITGLDARRSALQLDHPGS